MYMGTDTARALNLWVGRRAFIAQELAFLRKFDAAVEKAEWERVDAQDRESARILCAARTPVIDAIIRAEKAHAIAQRHVEQLRARLEDEEKGILWDAPVVFPGR